jgi:hypothetical protein
LEKTGRDERIKQKQMLKKWGLVGVDSIYSDKDKDMRPPFVNIIIHFVFYKGQVIS